jgi:BMFP domain-containing protein YqiC
MKLGYTPQDEIFRLRQRIAALEERLAILEAKEEL